jgi:cell fate regulator YaaT (PSP1 superfamily)
MESFAKISFFTKGCVSCSLPEGLVLVRGDKCVVAMDYGLDIGTCAGCDKPGGCDNTHDALHAEKTHRSSVVRIVNAQDLEQITQNEKLAADALATFTRLLAEENIFIKPLMAHFTLTRERLLIVFGAPEHLDCRKIVGKMQRDIQARIEVRHVGVRDEAAVVGGIGPCGRALCCATWLRKFHPVNVRMARTQNIALNPAALNGCCARLKCCLHFEYDTYLEASVGMPDVGTAVRWKDADEGVVVNRDVLRRRILVRTHEHGFQNVSVDEITVLTAPAPDKNVPVDIQREKT